ncbi:MAG TPA: PDZ domain-containing protein [Dongiaceae bacterium]|nr:PDZ domain-containing protein [Dongiaceae bacterium]
MNLTAKMFYRRKLAGWIITGLAALALGTVGAARVLADDDDKSDKGGAWLGVALQELTPSLREALDVDRHVEGLVIAGVMPDSPAEKAGLEERDILLSLNGKTVTSVNEATEQLQKLDPGDRITVSVLREGRRRQLTARVAERNRDQDSEWLQGLEGTPGPDVPNAPMPPLMAHPDDEGGHRGYLGVTTIELGEQLADYFGVHGDGGVLVTEVAKESPADEAGLKAGDVILSVGDSKVDSPSDLMRLVRAHDPEDQVDVVVQRRGQVQTLHAKLGETKDLGFFAPRGQGTMGHGMMAPEMHQYMMMLGPQIREHLHQHMRMMNERREGGTVEI